MTTLDSSQWCLHRILDDLRYQHAVDLMVYRSAHEHTANIRLHCVLIPCEVASFIWLFTTIMDECDKLFFCFGKNQCNLGMLLVTSLGWTLGIVSCIVATDLRLGLAVFLFHVLMVRICQRYVIVMKFTNGFAWALMVWIASWGLQIGVGHHIIENKPPNLFNPNDEVSLLSAMSSIILAWEC